MDFDSYQDKALETDQHRESLGLDGVKIPILGLAGETGTLLSELKKVLRDGEKHRYFPEFFREELGDILWYLSNIASKLGIRLSEVAEFNLEKVRDRWSKELHADQIQLDADLPVAEQFPRKGTFTFVEVVENGIPKVDLTFNGNSIGARIDDNSSLDDGYRFHDIFHIAHMTYLGWSPVLRGLMRRKRKSHPDVDRVQDGARATAIEEALTASVYIQAEQAGFFDGVPPSYDLLKHARQQTGGLEVRIRSLYRWEQAFLHGYRVYRELLKHKGGAVSVDLDSASMEFRPSY